MNIKSYYHIIKSLPTLPRHTWSQQNNLALSPKPKAQSPKPTAPRPQPKYHFSPGLGRSGLLTTYHSPAHSPFSQLKLTKGGVGGGFTLDRRMGGRWAGLPYRWEVWKRPGQA